jgi:hypothetical protein
MRLPSQWCGSASASDPANTHPGQPAVIIPLA